MKSTLKKILRLGWKILRTVLLIVLIPGVLYLFSWSYHRVHASILSSQSKWMHDLDVFEEALLAKHVNPTWISPNTQENIKLRIDSLRQVIVARNGNVNLDSMRVSMMQISAWLQDGHTHIANYNDDTGNFPLTLQFYKDGLFVVAADSGLVNLIGLKIVGINDFSIEQAIERIRTLCPSPNESSQKMYIEIYIKKPGLLHGLGLTTKSQSAVFHLVDSDGKHITADLNGFGKPRGLVKMEDIHQGDGSLHMKNSKKAYWYIHHAEKAVVYMKYNKVISMPNDPMDAFVNRLMKLIDSVEVKKFVIDVRNNTGGDNFFTAKLIAEIQKRPKINRRGVLYVVTGHQTFSAAICFVGNLSTRTQATLAGDPFGDFSNLPGDAKFFDLHMNQMTWQVSELFWENTYYDDVKNSLPVDLAYETSFTEDLKGENPILDIILNDSTSLLSHKWREPNPLMAGYTGRYRFSPDKTLHLDLKDGKVRLSGLIESNLTQLNDTVFRVSNLRFNLILSNNELLLMRDDSVKRVLSRLGENEFTALELIERFEYEQARKEYLILKDQFGSTLSAISGNNLSTTANYLYLLTGKNEMQLELLKIALEMYPDQVIPLSRMAVAKSINKQSFTSIYYRIKSLWYFDWRNIDNYGKAFGFY